MGVITVWLAEENHTLLKNIKKEYRLANLQAALNLYLWSRGNKSAFFDFMPKLLTLPRTRSRKGEENGTKKK